MLTKNRDLAIILAIVTVVLIIPLIAMQFTSEVNWNVLDFVVAGALLLGAGLVCSLIIRKVQGMRLRFALVIGAIILMLLIWAELAVGIFGTHLAGS